MLFRKMLREMRGNLGQFISVMILSFLATFIYSGFESNVVGSGKAVEDFHEETNIADAWIYSEGFKEENLDQVKNLDFVEDAQFRTEIRGTTVDYEGAQLDIYLMDESSILKPYLYRGAVGKENRLKESESVPFDGDDAEGVWLNWSFANEWDISVGDKIKLEYNGIKFERTVRGLIMEPEYEYTKAEKRGARMQKALNINLSYAHKFLDAGQYRKYLALMNNSLKNKGLDTLLSEEEYASK